MKSSSSKQSIDSIATTTTALRRGGGSIRTGSSGNNNVIHIGSGGKKKGMLQMIMAVCLGFALSSLLHSMTSILPSSSPSPSLSSKGKISRLYSVDDYQSGLPLVYSSKKSIHEEKQQNLVINSLTYENNKHHHYNFKKNDNYTYVDPFSDMDQYVLQTIVNNKNRNSNSNSKTSNNDDISDQKNENDGKDDIVFDGIVARPFQRWPIDKYPLPCPNPSPKIISNTRRKKKTIEINNQQQQQEDVKQPKQKRQQQQQQQQQNGEQQEQDDLPVGFDTGFLFLKPQKVGGSTVQGVQFRLARNVAYYQLGKDPIVESVQRQSITNMEGAGKRNFYNLTICDVNYGHARGVDFQFRNNIEGQSFLWSWIREPTQRVVSEFFHFHVSREKVEPTNENFQSMIEQNLIHHQNYYLNIHEIPHYKKKPDGGLGKRIRIPQDNFRQRANQILADFDFIGITERFDESVVVLQLLLGLRTRDVLYLNSKRNGSFDDGFHENKCFYIVPSFVSPGMKEYFNSERWKNTVQWDTLLYQAANRSLDLTIDQVIGRDVFDEQLKQFLWAQQLIHRHCIQRANFPCTSGGRRRKKVLTKTSTTDCLIHDAGCGTNCIDEIVYELDL